MVENMGCKVGGNGYKSKKMNLRRLQLHVSERKSDTKNRALSKTRNHIGFIVLRTPFLASKASSFLLFEDMDCTFSLDLVVL